MRRRGFIAGMNGPSRIEGNVVEDRRDGRRQAKGLIRRLVNERAIEPHHGFVVIPDLGAVMVVRLDVMKSNVAMNHRRMIAMRFMRMRRCNARRERQERRHDKTPDEAFNPPQHAVIMPHSRMTSIFSSGTVESFVRDCRSAVIGAARATRVSLNILDNQPRLE